MLISVIIPIYNGEKYIAECLDSVINQSFSSYEMVLVDDGSTDNSVRICQEYEKKYGKIKLILQKHKGASCARNTGLNHAQGDYIFFLDGDDAVHPMLFETLYDYVIKKGIAFAATALRLCERCVPHCTHMKGKADLTRISKEESIEWFGDQRVIYLTSIGGKLIKRAEIGTRRFDEDIFRGEDTLFVQNFIGQTDMAILKSPWYFYRMHLSSVVHTIDCENLACEYKYMTRIRDIEKERKHGKSAAYWEEILLYAIQYFYSTLGETKNSEKQLLLQEFHREKQSKYWMEDYSKYDITQNKRSDNRIIEGVAHHKYVADNPWLWMGRDETDENSETD